MKGLLHVCYRSEKKQNRKVITGCDKDECFSQGHDRGKCKKITSGKNEVTPIVVSRNLHKQCGKYVIHNFPLKYTCKYFLINLTWVSSTTAKFKCDLIHQYSGGSVRALKLSEKPAVDIL